MKYAAIYEVVRRVPRGRVATYGQIAELAGIPRHARQVGYALNALTEPTDVPWHRVINAQGKISTGRRIPGGDLRQRFRLEAEGVLFDASGKVSFQRYGWRPRPGKGRPARADASDGSGLPPKKPRLKREAADGTAAPAPASSRRSPSARKPRGRGPAS